jgi:hypothetical protein
MLIGDAAANAERPARSMAVAYMLRVVDMLFEVGVVDVYKCLVDSDSCVGRKSGILKAG